MYIPRFLEKKLLALFRQFPVVVVSGARQVGKSTLLKETFRGKADYVVFDPVLDVENARNDPDLFLANRKTPLILDEIQYVPALVSAIKRKIDRNRRSGLYLLTGSQQWEVMKALSESLAGRAAFLDLEGFSISEIVQSRTRPWLDHWFEMHKEGLGVSSKKPLMSGSLFDQIWRGWLPETHFLEAESIPSFFVGYQRTYIDRDLRQLFAISDWPLFGRFVRLLACLTGQEVNFSQLGRDIGLTPQTALRWTQMLSSTFQWFEVPPFSGNVLKRVSKKSKGYFTDSGLACFFQGISSPQVLSSHPSWGPLFETAVVGEIRKLCSFLPFKPQMYHWRSAGGAEVDLILEKDGVLFPIEIKANSHPRPNDARGILAFQNAYPHLNIAVGLILAPSQSVYPIGKHAWVIPWDLE